MVFLEISESAQENTFARVSFLIKLQALACDFIKKETLSQMFSFNFCKISKNTFFTEHLRATDSVHSLKLGDTKISFVIKSLELQGITLGNKLLWNYFGGINPAAVRRCFSK